MKKEIAERQIFDAMLDCGLARVRGTSAELQFEGKIGLSDREVAIRIQFPSIEFSKMPKVFLKNREQDLPESLAHIEEDGTLCYAAPGSIVLDRYQPAGCALTVLELARITLEEIASGRGGGAIRSEFPQHWQGARFYSVLPPGAHSGKAKLFAVPRTKARLLVLGRDAKDLSWLPTTERRSVLQSAESVVVLRTKATLCLEPGKSWPRNFADLLEWAAYCEPGLDKRLLNAAKTFFKKLPRIFVIAPNGCVGASLLLPSMMAKAIQTSPFFHQILETKGKQIPIDRLSGGAMDTNFLFNRNLAGKPSLQGKKIVLVGCGTIGGQLAKFLAQTGAGSAAPLVLIDPDTFAPGNVGRHWLGPSYIGEHKAVACREALLAMFPDSDIRAVSGDALEHANQIRSADLVLDATGEESVSLAINDLLVRNRPASPTAIHAWLAGNGAAAQVLSVHHDRVSGTCLKCLRTPLTAARPYWPIAPGHDAQEVPPACGEAAFVPYGVAAPAIAAGLAMKACLDWAQGANEPSMRTVRVNVSGTLEVPDCDPDPNPHCPACQLAAEAECAHAS